jgi:MoaA/NifB/PqqE/SkfB family radical SAM enzyme
MYSSQWLQELKKHGDYPNSRNFNTIKNQSNQPFLHSEHNPYVEAFWSWWPELYNDLDNFRITGGEPLLSKDTWKVLDYMLEQKNPNRKLKFAINTNLGVEDNLIDRLIEKLDRIINEDRVEEVILFTSIDAYGKHAEYIRTNVVWDRWLANILEYQREFKNYSNINFSIVTTISVYNIHIFEKIKTFFNNLDIVVNTNMLFGPEKLCSYNINQSAKDYLNELYKDKFPDILHFVNFENKIDPTEIINYIDRKDNIVIANNLYKNYRAFRDVDPEWYTMLKG